VSVAGGAATATRPEPVARLAGLSLGRLAWLQATHRRASAACLGLCLAIAIVLPALLPLLDGYALERAVADTAARDGAFTVAQRVADVDQFGGLQREVSARVDGRTAGALLPLTAVASTAQLHPTTLNTDPIPAELAGRSFQAAYMDGLPAHIEMQAGQLPPDGLGGGATAVTIPQAAADLAGLNLFDRVCLSFGTGDQRGSDWCARIVGLWRPLDVRDPFWGGAAPQLLFTMGRFDFFQLARLQPPQGTTASLRYWVNPSAVDGARAEQLAQTVHGLAAKLQAPGRRILTRLDAGLLRVTAQHRMIEATLRLFTAALALLGLVVVGLVGVRFVREQSHLLAVLRARGWPPARTWLQAFVGLVTPAVYGIPIALAACLLVLLLVGPAGSPAGVAALRSVQGRTALQVSGVLAGSLVCLLGVLATTAVWREVRPSLAGPFRTARVGRSRPLLIGLLALIGLAGLASVRLAPPPPGPASEALTLGLAVLPVTGVLCLAVAAALVPGPTRLGRGRRVPGLLAGWQLKRAPAQQAALAVALTLAAAAIALAVLAMAWAPVGAAAPDPALRAGLEATLGLGCTGALALLLMGSALHFPALTRRRLDEYAGLVGHGLSAPQIRRSLGLEQVVVVGRSVLLGTLLGVLMALLRLERPPPPAETIAPALAWLGAAAAVLLAGVLTVAALSRRLRDRPDPFRGGLET